MPKLCYVRSIIIYGPTLVLYKVPLINLIYSSTVIKYYRKTFSPCIYMHVALLRSLTLTYYFFINKKFVIFIIGIFSILTCGLLYVGCSYWLCIPICVHCWFKQLKVGRHIFKWPYDQIKFSKLNHTGITTLNSLRNWRVVPFNWPFL